MTVTYTAEVATCRGLGNFHRLLKRWRGSIYKLVWLDLLVYCLAYAALSCFYRFYLTQYDSAKEACRIFQDLVLYCDMYHGNIPLSFILGFYVTNVVTRWWSQFMLLPWPDSLATLISCNIHGNDDRGRMMRRTMMRYLNLSFVVTMGMMSTQAKKRFPTLNHLVEAGFLLPHEQVILENMNNKTKHPKYWAPIVWTGGILSRARREGRCSDDMSMNEIISQLTKYRSGLGDLLGFDWATIPLMYTQSANIRSIVFHFFEVVTLATYLYFVAALIGKQFINIDDQKIDLYVPFFTLVEFFFYVGWLKVAETLVNPFGEDDDDFEVNWLIDRNLQVSYLIVDEMHAEHPPMLKDAYWDETGPIDLPYTEAAIKYKTDGHAGSANYMGTEKADFVYLDDNDITAVKGARSMVVGRPQSLLAAHMEPKQKRFTVDGEFVKG